MSRRASMGRPAVMPAPGYQPPQRLFIDGLHCLVRFLPEPEGESKDFDFTTLPVARDLQVAFARAFHDHVGPAGQIKSRGAAVNCFAYLRQFCVTLAAATRPPRTAGELRPHHVDEHLLRRADLASGGMSLGVLRSLLINVEGLTPAFLAKCAESVPQRRDRLQALGSYSREEEHRILAAARDTIRTAAHRIRDNQDMLRRWRAGDPHLIGDAHRNRYCALLDGVERTGEVPRRADGTVERWVAEHGSVAELTLAMHLDRSEIAAFVILLVRLTGQNGSTIAAAPAAHHRTDGGAGPIATVQVDLDKPRRGRRRYMTAALSDLPTWAAAPSAPTPATSVRGITEVSARDELHTPFGVYLLALELTASARRITGSTRLLVYWIPKGPKEGRGFREVRSPGLVGQWGERLNLPADPTTDSAADSTISGRRLIVDTRRMRATHAAREQRPVAHADRTLADTYLRRDRTSLHEYQQLVADVLVTEVDKARALGTIPQLTAADLAEARRDPAAVAARFDVTEPMLGLLISREADTVLASCTDHLNSPHSRPGEPCRASFLKCLDCPCARALPHHLPLQVIARDLLDHRRTQLTALRWAQRFASPFQQLEDLLDKAGAAAVTQARQHVSQADREVVARLLGKELDHT